jgi:hypothetical protein
MLEKDIPDRTAPNQDLILSARPLRIMVSEAVAGGSCNQFKQQQKEEKGRRGQTFLRSPSFTNGASLSYRKSPDTLNSLNS